MKIYVVELDRNDYYPYCGGVFASFDKVIDVITHYYEKKDVDSQDFIREDRDIPIRQGVKEWIEKYGDNDDFRIEEFELDKEHIED